MATRARVSASSVPTPDDLEAMAASVGPLAAPENLGNFPNGEPPAPEPEPSAQIATPPELEPAEPEPAAEPESEPSEPPPSRPWEERLAAIERENQFLRAALQRPATPQAPPTPPDPIQTLRQFLPYEVTDQDVQTILADPTKGAEYLTNMMRAAALAGAAMGSQAAKGELEQRLNTTEQNRSLRDQFWAGNMDLAPYHDLVQTHSNRVYAEGGRNNEQFVAEVSRRTRDQLRGWGVRIDGQSQPVGQRLRPARGEGGGTGRSVNGRGAVSTFDRDLFQLMNAR